MPRRDTLEPRRHVAARFLFGCTPSARKVRTLAVVLTIALGIVSLKLPLESLLPQYAFRKDFVQEYVLARAVAERADPYVPIARLVAEYLGVVPEAVFPHPTPHPPTVGLLFLPLALTDYNTAAALWLAFEVVCLLVAVHVLRHWPGTLSPMSWALASS